MCHADIFRLSWGGRLRHLRWKRVHLVQVDFVMNPRLYISPSFFPLYAKVKHRGDGKICMQKDVQEKKKDEKVRPVFWKHHSISLLCPEEAIHTLCSEPWRQEKAGHASYNYMRWNVVHNRNAILSAPLSKRHKRDISCLSVTLLQTKHKNVLICHDNIMYR